MADSETEKMNSIRDQIMQAADALSFYLQQPPSASRSEIIAAIRDDIRLLRAMREELADNRMEIAVRSGEGTWDFQKAEYNDILKTIRRVVRKRSDGNKKWNEITYKGEPYVVRRGASLGEFSTPHINLKKRDQKW
jgi:hypothetical protein